MKEAMADPVQRLRAEFRTQQSSLMVRARLRQGRNRVTAALGGALVGCVTVAAAALVTQTALYVQAFFLEAAVGLVAGYLLGRMGGGILKGALLFALAFLVIQFMRSHGLDPSFQLMPIRDFEHAASAHGGLLGLLIMLTCGGVLGQIVGD
jgi:hypothetical protein